MIFLSFLCFFFQNPVSLLAGTVLVFLCAHLDNNHGKIRVLHWIAGFILIIGSGIVIPQLSWPIALCWLILKSGFPGKRSFLLSAILAALVFASFAPDWIPASMFCLHTFFGTLAVCRVFSDFRGEREQTPSDIRRWSGVRWVHTGTLKGVLASVAIGIAAGLVLGAVNIALRDLDAPIAQTPIVWQPSLRFALDSLSPAVWEEVVYRALPFCTCLFVWRSLPDSKARLIAAWFLNIVPHVMIHIPQALSQPGYTIRYLLLSQFSMLLLFGIPITILQRRRDMLSAMVTHGLIDLIRFFLLGA